MRQVRQPSSGDICQRTANAHSGPYELGEAVARSMRHLDGLPRIDAKSSRRVNTKRSSRHAENESGTVGRHNERWIPCLRSIRFAAIEQCQRGNGPGGISN